MYRLQIFTSAVGRASAASFPIMARATAAQRCSGRAGRGLLRRFGRQLGLVAALMLAAMSVQAQSVEDGYAPVVNDRVFATAMQADGKVLIGGHFTKVNGETCEKLCRLLPDGSIDPLFVRTNPNDSVWVIVVQADGRILIGGDFDHVGGHSRFGAARLSSDGSVDTGFVNPELMGTSTSQLVKAFALQADGKILVAGSFDSARGEARHAIARLKSNGTLDASFIDAGVENMVRSVVVQPDGKLLIGGNFNHIDGQWRPEVARLNSDGSVDTGFAAVNQLTGMVEAVALRADGKIMIGGHFEFYSDSYNYLMRLNADGTIDTSFADLHVSREVYSLAWQPDGKLLVGGAFTEVGGQPRSKLARLEVDGSLDSSFKPNQITTIVAYHGVNTLIAQNDGKVIVGGYLSTTTGQNHLVRLNVDGSVDTDMDPRGDDLRGGVSITALQPDGKVLIVESFQIGLNEWVYGITRLNLDGSTDASFVDPVPDGVVQAMAVQTDGKVLVSAPLDTFAGQPGTYLARLNADGSLDTSFRFNGCCGPRQISIQPDGKILIFGVPLYNIDGHPVEMLARLNPDGSLDTSFTPASISFFLMDNPTSMRVQPDGKIVIAGPFYKIGGVSRSGLARLNADGSLDTGFQPPETPAISTSSMALFPDGKLLVKSAEGLRRLNVDGSLDTSFTGPNGTMNISSYAIQADGKIVLATGDEYQDSLLRLNPNGTPDLNFTQIMTDNRVMSLTPLPDGTLLLGGDFNQVGSEIRSHVARVSVPATGQQTLDVVGDKVTWHRSGSSPELHTAPMLYYSSGGAFTPLGPMTRVAGGWQRTGAPLPVDSFYYLRAEGQVGSAQIWGQGTGLIQSTRQAYNAEILFTNGFD